MRKSTLLILFIALLAGAKAQTTEEEMKWCQKGYPDHINKGEDIKIGYRVDDGYSDTINNCHIWIKYLVKISSNQNAAIIFCQKDLSTLETRYACIPQFNSDMETVRRPCMTAFFNMFVSSIGTDADRANVAFLLKSIEKSVSKERLK
jgi:hypothetical protein